MPESFHGRIPATLMLTGAVVLVLLQAVVVVGEFPATMTLERAFPADNRVELGELRNRDGLRHRRILQQQDGNPDVVDFRVQGTYDPYRVGLYYTKVQLGSPPKDYYVQIDTGSDVLWVSCTPCNGCPTSSGLQIPMDFYDPSSSSTSSVISCSDQRCSQASRSSDSGCNNKQCSYNFQYGDGSGTSGYYVSDYMHLNTIGLDSATSNSSANVVFGCSTSQSGDLTKTDRAVEGIFGFGQNGLSIISQLSSQGIAPDSFSHCLVGSGSGGGILIIGQILDPDMVFTPLVQSQPHYNVNLQSISVNGQTLPIDPSTFAISDNQGGTIIDSGTTLAYLAEAAYTPFVDAITQSVSQSVQPLISKGNRCYLITSSVSSIFPTVSLNFAGGASMHLRPQDYLLQQNSVNGAEVWCIGFQTISNQGITILGDLVLKDKIIVYDLGGQRIGWADYDCSTSVNVSSTSRGGRSEVVNAGQFNAGTSLQITRYELTAVFILASILHLAMTIGGFSL
ncbi:putative nepenthesin [Helianthus annuus]|uniref:Nepenthesin n=1 Tax=Helianthus annuus TaxID=4232 RepID=A0A251UBX6_HELAN|nr:aspartic proteinase-like protein 2 [Helianthus annuus]KAF5799561.1 putative nepenthesin [Helianthus annuus]